VSLSFVWLNAAPESNGEPVSGRKDVGMAAVPVLVAS